MTTRPDSPTDAASRARFVRDGHLVVRTGLPDEFHQAIYAKIEAVFEKEGNVGNNILPRVPEIQQVYDDPAVAGALQSLLGPGYIMNPHRHCHLNPPGGKGQSWHKDCYVFDHNLRHARFRWVMAFYYPQDTTPDMGPTGVLPGQQWYRTISDPDPARATEREEALSGDAGTVSIVHFDTWHRATANRSDRKRYMLKFQFARTAEPTHADGPRGVGCGGVGGERRRLRRCVPLAGWGHGDCTERSCRHGGCRRRPALWNVDTAGSRRRYHRTIWSRRRRRR